MLKNFIQKSWLALAAALCFGLLVAAVSMALEPRIKQNKIDKRNNSLAKLYGEECTYEPVTAKGADEDAEPLYFVAKQGEEIAGYAIIWTGAGFAENIDLLVGFDKNLDKLKGFAVMKSAETPGFGDQINFEADDGKPDVGLYFKDRFIDRPINKKLVRADDNDPFAHEGDNQIVTITGSTVTSEAVIMIINGAKKEISKLIK